MHKIFIGKPITPLSSPIPDYDDDDRCDERQRWLHVLHVRFHMRYAHEMHVSSVRAYSLILSADPKKYFWPKICGLTRNCPKVILYKLAIVNKPSVQTKAVPYCSWMWTRIEHLNKLHFEHCYSGILSNEQQMFNE